MKVRRERGRGLGESAGESVKKQDGRATSVHLG